MPFLKREKERNKQKTLATQLGRTVTSFGIDDRSIAGLIEVSSSNCMPACLLLRLSSSLEGATCFFESLECIFIFFFRAKAR